MRRQPQVHAMQHDITDDAPDAATDTLSYEAMPLRFQEAREASRALWHWQEVDAAACNEEDTGRDALADTLANTFLADSAPQEQRAHAPVDTAQATLAFFLAKEGASSIPPPAPPAFEGIPDTASGPVDTPPSAPADLDCGSATLPASDTAEALLTAGDAESLDSSISPSVGAIKPRAQASSAVDTARGDSESAQEQGTPGDVLNDLSPADTLFVQPPPLVSVSSSKSAAPFTRQNTANASMPAFAAGMPSLFHRIFSLPAPRQLLLPFTHRLPPLLRRDLPPPPPPSQPAHKTLDSKSQAQSQPRSLDSWRGALKRHYSSEAHRLEAPSNSQRPDKSGHTDDAGHSPTLLADTAAVLSTITDAPQPPDSDIWQPRAPKDNDSLDSGYSTDQDDTASAHSNGHKRSASNSAPFPPSWPASPPPFSTSQATHKAPGSAPQAHIHPLFLNSWASSGQRVGDSGDSDDAAPFSSVLEGTAAFFSAFPDTSDPLDADSGRRCALLDTGQHLCLGNNSTKQVHLGEPQNSAVDKAATGDSGSGHSQRLRRCSGASQHLPRHPRASGHRRGAALRAP
jgi:hypothetical protein